MDDAPACFAMRSDPETMRYVRRPLATTLEDASGFISRVQDGQRANTCAQWAMTLKGNDICIGVIGPWRIDPENHRGELGYMMARAHRVHSLMSEAVATVADHAWVDPQNLASMRVLEKNGFIREAYFRENVFWGGTFSDSVVFCRLAKP
jgi:ribosomal-protein-alanine N-acetyltransferase